MSQVVLEFEGTSDQLDRVEKAFQRARSGFPDAPPALRTSYRLMRASFRDQMDAMRSDVVKWVEKTGVYDENR